jgi:hypothetical protein
VNFSAKRARWRLGKVYQFFAEIMERLIAEHESSRLPDHLPAERKRNGPVRRKNWG